MNIGIIVYSHTGHTLHLANEIEARLSKESHNVTLERLRTVVPLSMGATRVDLKTIPAVEQYDALLLGTPVRGGLPSPPVIRFIEQSASFKGKKVGCFATGFFKASWGQNQTLDRMKELCENKSAEVVGIGSVRWFSFTRKQQITDVSKHLSALF